MKKFLMAVMAMFLLVSCADKYDKIVALYEDATAKMEVAETRGEMTDIDDQLEKDIEAVSKEYEEETEAELEAVANGDEALEKEMEEGFERIAEAAEAYNKAKRVRREQLRD